MVQKLKPYEKYKFEKFSISQGRRVLTFYPFEPLKFLMCYVFKKANKSVKWKGRKEILIDKAIVVEGLGFRSCDSTRKGCDCV